ncbi:inositol monophosphatase family protein [Leucobacter ruminantium]|uniref:Inositol-1-monophosphatase n=1 Tax=Leucobacter ruminantium TaxID=1289170 RepID=A0A939RY22_9MICO|nr:inositol monophosphatase family protein [Leucobacter ruminantium]MBO1804411.1 inositol monophosphatase [Leucobacter ruminantium]
MTNIQELSAFATRIAREAGAIAMEGFRNRELGIDLKADFHDMVTKYDRACEEHIRGAILEAYPGSTIVGEEDGASEGSGPLAWHIDPIDGTANFARGMALWAVSIGIARDGEMIVGVVYDPANDHMFMADDRGAFLNDEPMRSWGFTRPEQATVVLNFPLPRDLVHLPELALEQFTEASRQFAQVRALGSSCISLCWVAAGWVDATVSFEANSWDVAASAFIVRQAGGAYRSYLGGEEQPPERDYLNPHYYATVPGGDYPILEQIMLTQSERPLPADHPAAALLTTPNS